MAAFREYSDKYPFRHRSETPDIAIELSLQCWREFGMDGVIMFSDILTPLPAMGIDFDVVKGKGPIISDPVRSMDAVKALKPLSDPSSSLPFVGETLRALRKETEGRCTLLGFVGAPFTLAAYSVNGAADKHCADTKKMMYRSPEVLHAFLDHLAEAIGHYAIHQVEEGAQVIQFFESWAHHLTPEQFELFAKPYANKAMGILKDKYPEVPVIYFANGGSSYLERQRDMHCDSLCIDWQVDMATARSTLGPHVAVSGNMDPLVLFSDEETIRAEVRKIISKAGGPGAHLLNLGHGVMQGTPEESVAIMVDEAKTFLPDVRGEFGQSYRRAAPSSTLFE
uniref:uroporphyrinogen decarboxylase n=1 Tax=Rhizochromulina marina TaxID=1034831 RepID=A0A7S2SS32_9STRA